MKRVKRILVTGANRGIGLELVKQLAAKGHRLILGGRNPEKGKEAIRGLAGDIAVVALDVTNQESVDAACALVKDKFKTLDVLINNAGSALDPSRRAPSREGALSTPVDTVRKTFETNVLGPYRMARTFLPLFPEDQRGDIINISSGMGALTDMNAGAPAYRMSKAALNAMTVNLQAELAATNLFVNSVCPGWVRTDLGGPTATRAVTESTIGVLWLLEEEPELRGRFIRDRDEIPF